MKDKKSKSKREPIKLRFDQGRGNLIRKWLVDNDILML